SRIAETVGVSHSSRRAQSMSEAPASAKPSAISSPIPRDPPVTMAMRSCSENNSLMVGTLSGLYFENFHDANAGHDHRRQIPHGRRAVRRHLHARRAH